MRELVQTACGDWYHWRMRSWIAAGGFALAASMLVVACSDDGGKKSDAGAVVTTSDAGAEAGAGFDTGEELRVTVAEGQRAYVTLASGRRPKNPIRPDPGFAAAPVNGNTAMSMNGGSGGTGGGHGCAGACSAVELSTAAAVLHA